MHNPIISDPILSVPLSSWSTDDFPLLSSQTPVASVALDQRRADEFVKGGERQILSKHHLPTDESEEEKNDDQPDREVSQKILKLI